MDSHKRETQKEQYEKARRQHAASDQAMVEIMQGPNPITQDEFNRLAEKHPERYERFRGYVQAVLLWRGLRPSADERKTMQSNDVTESLLAEAAHVWRSQLASVPPARSPLPKTLEATRLAILDNPTMGWISNALTYSRIVYSAQARKNLFRLLKGGHLRVVLVNEPAPPDCKDNPSHVGVDRRHYRIEAAEAFAGEK